MAKMLLLCTILCIAFFTINALYITPEEIDANHYCGIEPYPMTIKSIPPLSLESRQLKLQQLDHHIFFRHGDRSTIAEKCYNNLPEFNERVWVECPNPIYNFHTGLSGREINNKGPTDRANYRYSVQPYPNKGVLNGNCHFGGLSQKGVLMSYNNGMRYARYLNQTQTNTVTQSQFRTRSTDYHRTRETGESFMTGVWDQLPSMFPVPTDFTPQRNVPTFTWVEGSVDSLAMNDNMCSTKEYLKEAYAAPEWLDYKAKVYDPLNKLVGDAIQNPNADIYDNFDCLKTLYCHQNPIPAGLTPLHTQMEAALLNYYIQAFQFNHAKANRYYTGVWATDLITILSPLLSSTFSGKTYYINSGHDSNIQAIMSFLDWGNRQWPAYSALFQMEIYKTTSNNKAYVRFIYDAEVVIPKFCTTVTGSELCSLTDFIVFLSTAIPVDGECAGIPRSLMNSIKAAVPEMQKRDELPKTIVPIFEQLIKKMDSIYAEQDKPDKPLLASEPLIQPSHAETWANMNSKW